MTVLIIFNKTLIKFLIIIRKQEQEVLISQISENPHRKPHDTVRCP